MAKERWQIKDDVDKLLTSGLTELSKSELVEYILKIQDSEEKEKVTYEEIGEINGETVYIKLCER